MLSRSRGRDEDKSNRFVAPTAQLHQDPHPYDDDPIRNLRYECYEYYTK